MPAFEGNNELDLGSRKRLTLNGASFVKTQYPNSWTARNYKIDFSQFPKMYFTPSFNILGGVNTVTHNLNLNNPQSVMVQAYDTTSNQYVSINPINHTGNSFDFNSVVTANVRISILGL